MRSEKDGPIIMHEMPRSLNNMPKKATTHLHSCWEFDQTLFPRESLARETITRLNGLFFMYHYLQYVVFMSCNVVLTVLMLCDIVL